MKKWLFILATPFVVILLCGKVFSATYDYDATGIWVYTTEDNWVNPGNAGCPADPDTTSTATVTQTGDAVELLVQGLVFTGNVSGATYTLSASYPEDWGTTTVTVSFTLDSQTTGSGTGYWYWEDDWGEWCEGGSKLSLTKQTDPPSYTNTSGIWNYQTSNPWATRPNCLDDPESGLTAVEQNGDTFTYVDSHGIHTGRISGLNYFCTISYYEEYGITTESIFFTLNGDGTFGSGTVNWTWTDGTDSCSGGSVLTVNKSTAPATFDATGVWNYQTSHPQASDPFCLDDPESGTLSLTQDGNTFRYAGYKGIQTGFLSGATYVSYVSYPEDNGTTTEALIFNLTDDGTRGSGIVNWTWTDGTRSCTGRDDLTVIKTNISNNPPVTPALSSPPNNSTNVSLTPTLVTGSFSDPDHGAKHYLTEWQISTSSSFVTTVLHEKTPLRLTSLPVPQFVLSPGTQYYWRVRHYDDLLRASTWSEIYAFTTTTTTNDSDGDGVPDSQENNRVDLDGDGTADSEQDHIKSLNTVVGNVQMGISRRDDPTVTAIGSIESIDPATISNIARPYYMPFGLFGAELAVVEPIDGAEVTIYFSQAAPDGVKWFVHTSIDGWVDYSKQATFSEDRKSVRVKLKDWGYGDSDGIPNGTIVDPGGIGLASWIKGNIWDSSTDQPINYAVITISGLVLRTLSDGNYLSMILPGTYTVSVSADGYESSEVGGVQIPEGEIVTKDFFLKKRLKDMPWIPLLLFGD